MAVKPSVRRNPSDLAKAWDELAAARHHQIESGEDISFHHVIVPTVWRLLEGCDLSVVLDVGAGTGHFTASLAAVAGKVIAIEPSQVSIGFARRACASSSNVNFIQETVEEVADQGRGDLASAAVSVMSLMTAPSLDSFADSLSRLLERNGKFIAVFTHPWFWPRHWGYDSEPWFKYKSEIFIEAPFAISKQKTSIITVHIHRPLEQYISTFSNYGFLLDNIIEPVPRPEIQALYPSPGLHPRFLGVRWVRG